MGRLYGSALSGNVNDIRERRIDRYLRYEDIVNHENRRERTFPRAEKRVTWYREMCVFTPYESEIKSPSKCHSEYSRISLDNGISNHAYYAVSVRFISSSLNLVSSCQISLAFL